MPIDIRLSHGGGARKGSSSYCVLKFCISYFFIMSGVRIIYFMYHHYQHCIANISHPPNPKSMDTFTLFPLLPSEIRIKIWQTVASEPQTVELSCTPTSSYLPRGRWFTHNKPPTIFSINSESREVALLHYSILTFSPDQIGVPWPKIYFNFDQDTLWLCDDLCSIWARDLLEKNEQLKTQLRFLSVEKQLWKSLNQTVFPLVSNMNLPGMAVSNMDNPPIKENFTALEDLKSH
jgi:hypothetical protein